MVKSDVTCPKCHSNNVAEILYGEVVLDTELAEALENGEVFLGGCCIFSDSPKYHCNDCKHEFIKPLKDDNKIEDKNEVR